MAGFTHLRLTRAARLAVIAATTLGIALLAPAGCARGGMAIRPLRTTLLVMDFTVPEDYAANPHRVEGFWFGSHAEHRNDNAGQIFADVVTEEMRREMDWVNLFSRLDVHRYFAKKRELLKAQFKGLTDGKANEMIGQVSPMAYAKELGADRILIGRIIQSKTFIQKTVKYWYSTIEVECTLLDVESGKTLWQFKNSRTGRWEAQKTVMEKTARVLVGKMRDEYFYNPEALAAG